LSASVARLGEETLARVASARRVESRRPEEGALDRVEMGQRHRVPHRAPLRRPVNLAARLRQNTVSEKLTNLWLDRLFAAEDLRTA
jgi:hypothetical protein